MDIASAILLTGIIVYWFICTIYMIMWHVEYGNLNFGTILLAILFSVGIAPVLYREEKKLKTINKRRILEDEVEVYGRYISARGHSMPPPAPRKKREFKFLTNDQNR